MQEKLDMPTLGYGTYGRRGTDGLRALREALAIGYRHLDTAQDYGNETEVGQAMRDSGLSRDKIFVTTKVATGNLAADRVLASLHESLARMKLDHVDLALIHWPAPNGSIDPATYLPELKKAQESGICRHIGVSNFTIALLQRAEEILGAGALAVNQFELNPVFKNRRLAKDCQSRGIMVTCYLPIARGRLSGVPAITAIANAHSATAEQVALAWELACGYSAIPASSNPGRMALNFAATQIRLTAADMAQIDALADMPRQIDPDGAPEWDE